MFMISIFYHDFISSNIGDNVQFQVTMMHAIAISATLRRSTLLSGGIKGKQVEFTNFSPLSPVKSKQMYWFEYEFVPEEINIVILLSLYLIVFFFVGIASSPQTSFSLHCCSLYIFLFFIFANVVAYLG